MWKTYSMISKSNFLQNHMKRAMSQLRLDLRIDNLKDIIFPLTSSLHKGQCGRIGVVGGSREYTGAPYFSGMTALRLGADLAHVFCTEGASTAIKCYSPDLIVHPILDDENALTQLMEWEKRLHAIVIGPGLGRDPKIIDVVAKFIQLLHKSGKPVIIDADGLHIITQLPHLLENSMNVTLTPNKIEFERLCSALSKEKSVKLDESNVYQFLSPGITIVQKGAEDKIFNSSVISTVIGGSHCRCGGQGDVLSGAIALFTYWAMEAKCENASIVGGFLGCYFTKELNRTVYNELGRSMVTGDFIRNIHTVYKKLFCS